MIDEVYESLQDGIKKAQEALGRQLGKLRTGRASLALLDGIKVDYYGQPTPLNQMASLSVPEPRLIVIRPWDRNGVHAVERALLTSDLGLTPTTDGEFIRIPIPTLTEERRRDLVKLARTYAEDCKVAIRHARRDANDMLDAFRDDGEVPEDDAVRGKKRVQELTDEGIKKVDEILARKEKDIMEV